MRERSGDIAPDRHAPQRARLPARPIQGAPGTSAAQLLRLQSRLGNRGVSRLLAYGATSTAVQRARYPVSGRGRMQRPTLDVAIAGMDYLVGPDYTASPVRDAGGSHSTATLGPTGSFLNAPSDAVSSLPRAIRAARVAYPAASFKAGHLLNAAFGGDGADSANLTILSAAGNANHKAFDEPVKKAVTALQAAYRILWEDGIDVSQESIGIAVSVAVTGSAWGGVYPATCIFDALTCSAAVVGSLSEPLSNADAQAAFDAAMEVVAAYCATATAAGAISNPRPMDSGSDDDSEDDSGSDGPGAGSRRTREGEGVTATTSSSKMEMSDDDG